jgi:NAD(P)-dependent dehydrogenase (short-subunit alcohol dehydrogenase family)
MAGVDGTTIIVTGGAQGIGRGMVEHFLQRGARVVVADVDREAGEELLAYLEAHDRLAFFATDVRKEDEVKSCIEHTLQRFDAIHGLVNNAGIANPGRTPVTELPLAAWETMIGTNLTGAFLMTKYAGPFLREVRGAIVNIASTRALQSEPHTEAYAASKGGLVAFTHALAASFAHTVRVNCILPGWIDVSGHRKLSERYDPRLTEEDHRQHPVGRVGIPRDIASLAAFLLSGEAAFITGQSFVVDGGMTKKMIYA